MHLENLLFILLIAVAALFRLLANKAGDAASKKSEPPQRSASIPRPNPPPPLPPADSDEERIRRFLEALGQPPSSKPPPRVTPRTDIPPRPVTPIQPPPGMRPFALPPRRLTPEERRKRGVILHETVAADWPPLSQTVPAAAEVTPRQSGAPAAATVAMATPQSFPTGEVTVFPPSLPTLPEKAIASSSAADYETQSFAGTLDYSLGALIASPEGLRNAIILREIFGPPRSLQPLHLVEGA